MRIEIAWGRPVAYHLALLLSVAFLAAWAYNVTVDSQDITLCEIREKATVDARKMYLTPFRSLN